MLEPRLVEPLWLSTLSPNRLWGNATQVPFQYRVRCAFDHLVRRASFTRRLTSLLFLRCGSRWKSLHGTGTHSLTSFASTRGVGTIFYFLWFLLRHSFQYHHQSIDLRLQHKILRSHRSKSNQRSILSLASSHIPSLSLLYLISLSLIL
jgi:hypothetical protein